MLGLMRESLRRRRECIRETEKLVANFGSRGVAMAEGFATDPNVSAERREHFRRVAYHAKRRNDFIASLDTATRFQEVSKHV